MRMLFLFCIFAYMGLRTLFGSLLVLSLLLPCAAWGQRLPASLENPANCELDYMYSKVYKDMRSFRVAAYSQLGVTALGGAMLLWGIYGTSESGSRYPEVDGQEGDYVKTGGNPVPAILGAVLLECGATGTVACFAGDLIDRVRLKNIRAENDFLLQPGNSEGMWMYNRAAQRVETTHKIMRISGLATCCCAVYTAAGAMVGSSVDTPFGNFMNNSAEAAFLLGLAGGVTYLTSWIVNSSSRNTMLRLESDYGRPVASLSPFVAPSTIPGSGPALGLCLTARF